MIDATDDPGEQQEGDAARLARLRAALRADAGAPHDGAAGSDADLAAAESPAGPAGDGEPEPEEAEPLPTADPLPEHAWYRDTGCHVAPACLSCPLPACIFDRGPRDRRRALQARNRRLRALAAQGWTTRRLAERFALSPARVRRIRAAARTRRPPGPSCA